MSSDIVNSPASCVFDAGLTMAQGHLVKVLGWYDNESGYSSRLADLAALVGAADQALDQQTGERQTMFQVRIHGRGGQGVVTAAELLSMAAFAEGRHAQAFPSFGSERMGAPVVSFCRIDDRPIRTREPVMAPDALVIQDVTLIHQVDLFAGLTRGRLRPRQHLAQLR